MHFIFFPIYLKSLVSVAINAKTSGSCISKFFIGAACPVISEIVHTAKTSGFDRLVAPVYCARGFNQFRFLIKRVAVTLQFVVMCTAQTFDKSMVGMSFGTSFILSLYGFISTPLFSLIDDCLSFHCFLANAWKVNNDIPYPRLYTGAGSSDPSGLPEML